MVFALLMNDEGDLTVLSYDWQTKATLPGQLMAALSLFDEARPGMTWEDDAMIAASLLRVKLNEVGYEINDEETYEKHVRTICTPGPGISGELRFTADRIL